MLVAALLGACTQRQPIGRNCTFRSDCQEGLFCVGGLCSEQCRVDLDCPTGQVCRSSGVGNPMACVAPPADSSVEAAPEASLTDALELSTMDAADASDLGVETGPEASVEAGPEAGDGGLCGPFVETPLSGDGGACALTCPGTAGCIDRNTDGRHCGRCARPCCGGFCQAGACTSFRFTQLDAAEYHVCARRSDGRALCWGTHNFTANLGLGNTDSSVGTLPTTPVVGAGATEPELLDVRLVAVGDDSSCAVVGAEGRVFCWGLSNSGQAGVRPPAGTTGDYYVLRPSPVLRADGSPLLGVTALSGGPFSMCAVAGAGAALCWGDNTNGGLGVPTLPSSERAVAVQRGAPSTGAGSPLVGLRDVQVGRDFACALSTDGDLYCWGLDTSGQLGRPLAGSDLRAALVPLRGPTAAACTGFAHACAALSDGTVWCWGQNSYGQVGQPLSSSAVAAPAQVTGVANAVELSCGAWSTCAALRDGSVRCWGTRDAGQLGDGTGLDDDAGLPPVTGSVRANIEGVVQLEGGYLHHCALRVDGSVWCWGAGANGSGFAAVATPTPAVF